MINGQIDLFAGREDRDAGLEKVRRETFRKNVQWVVSNMIGLEVTADDIRAECERLEIGAHHSNAWGAAIMGLRRDGFLAHYGEHRQSSRKSNHARDLKVYTVRTPPRNVFHMTGICAGCGGLLLVEKESRLCGECFRNPNHA